MGDRTGAHGSVRRRPPTATACDRQLVQAEGTRESKRQQLRDANLDTLLGGFEAPEQAGRIERAQQKRAAKVVDLQESGQGVPGDFVAGSTAPIEVQSEIAKQVADYIRRGRDETSRKARLGGFGDADLENAIDISRSSGELDMLGDFTRGSQGALGFELQDARKAGDQWANFSDLLGAAGTALSLYSFMQPAAGATGAITSADTLGQSRPLMPWQTEQTFSRARPFYAR
jgi:hypothetical protein